MSETAGDSTRRFSTRASYYVRARPRYPAAVMQLFKDELQLGAGDAVADIASGTGFLTELFVANGNPTYAVEPNAEMRAAAEAALAQYPNFHSINATAEATTLAAGSVKLVTAAQAVHWFDLPAAAKEFRRILTPGGFVAVVWNRRLKQTPVGAAYEQLTQRFQTQPHVSKARDLLANGGAAMAPLFGTRGFAIRRFDNPQRLDWQGLVDRIVSSSYMPLPGEPRYAEMLEAAKELFERHGPDGVVSIPQETLVYFGSLDRPASRQSSGGNQ